MGSAEIENRNIVIYSHIITYGNAATTVITELIREEIETMWNEPNGTFIVDGLTINVLFRITATYKPEITDIDIYQNLDPRNNYFRIEEFAHGNISFVDGLGCNSGYFKLENLYKGSTTAAHEYGHTLGLEHPEDLDIRGKGVPGIMYPRGTLVDPQYQYESDKPAGSKGGTMHPMFRKVLQADIENLQLHRLNFKNNKAVLGEFTNVWHPDHSTIDPNPFWG
ncbi:MAG TPA: peptidase M10 [Chitinophagaceae bacterium]|nr:peptidase M10 [Chitinophagaceae bacterium]